MKKKIVLGVALGLFFTAQNVAANVIPIPKLMEILQKEYKEITPAEVNKEALTNIQAKYGDYQITQAAVAADGEYKLTLKKDNASITALFTSAGDLIKIL
ncbi:hypothetical protein GV828_12370 [Flavobacterium sp. NST-5]|uniref:Beta-lactamase-inhibitor-like PepSY-like domain-containing protein n=1 Tax=Flavobacterium ichthyis TaxID=2698827 RepID=A0ABW9ZBA3_9FLAO|nr:hypothetical protein [Flavobacterium ichthyis]NBL65994.1 hypothetical protein [Flavobacterium ichthyis]